ncbi:hypothetical protein Tco_1249794 [Tanacetum coccineum]
MLCWGTNIWIARELGGVAYEYMGGLRVGSGEDECLRGEVGSRRCGGGGGSWGDLVYRLVLTLDSEGRTLEIVISGRGGGGSAAVVGGRRAEYGCGARLEVLDGVIGLTGAVDQGRMALPRAVAWGVEAGSPTLLPLRVIV